MAYPYLCLHIVPNGAYNLITTWWSIYEKSMISSMEDIL